MFHLSLYAQEQFVAGAGVGAQILMSIKMLGLAEPAANWVLEHGANAILERGPSWRTAHAVGSVGLR